jgi:hypothetical protein
MEQLTYDPCLLFSTILFGVIRLQTDDTLFITDAKFAIEEQIQL